MTGQALINSALRLDVVLASGESPEDAESNDALVILNQMLDSWAIERLLASRIRRDIYSLPSGQQTRTFGDGGDWDADRPVKIERMGIVTDYSAGSGGSEGGTEIDAQYTIDANIWGNIPVKNLTGTPCLVWDEDSFPLRTLHFYPIPTSAVSAAVYSWAAVSQFASLSDDVDFPPGYIEAMRYNLAVRLAAEWGKTLADQTVIGTAMELKGKLKNFNIPDIKMSCDPAILGSGSGYNILTNR